MHSIANLATLHTPLANFEDKKSAQTLFSLFSIRCKVLMSQHALRAHISLSLSVQHSAAEEQRSQLNTDIMLLL